MSDSRQIVRQLEIGSPKRDRRLQTGWEGFFPYYAGYPGSFASKILASAKLKRGSVVLDPWNGSGTTTYASAQLGLVANGLDLNPVMVIVARARLLAPSEADALRPLAATIISHLRVPPEPRDQDPLNTWFSPATAAVVRAIEEKIRRTVVGELTLTAEGTELGQIAGTAATLYVALFSACRALAAPYKSSNPTWLRKPRLDEAKIEVARSKVVKLFAENVRGMAAALKAKATTCSAPPNTEWSIDIGDSAGADFGKATADFILTSPPYCTRIDYTAATRVELAVLAPLLNTTSKELGRRMIGTTQVPKAKIEPSQTWGPTCNRFLEGIKAHTSKASAGYYYNTHLDYFEKMARSLRNLSDALKPTGAAILVVQDSYYKELHNDLPCMIAEMAAERGLELVRSERFAWEQSMSRINPHTKAYQRPSRATESVLCFAKA